MKTIDQKITIVCFNTDEANSFSDAIEKDLLHETLDFTNLLNDGLTATKWEDLKDVINTVCVAGKGATPVFGIRYAGKSEVFEFSAEHDEFIDVTNKKFRFIELNDSAKEDIQESLSYINDFDIEQEFLVYPYIEEQEKVNNDVVNDILECSFKESYNSLTPIQQLYEALDMLNINSQDYLAVNFEKSDKFNKLNSYSILTQAFNSRNENIYKLDELTKSYLLSDEVKIEWQVNKSMLEKLLKKYTNF